MTYAPEHASNHSTDRWENEGGPARLTEVSAADDLQSELNRYGVTPVQLTVFDWGGYRYSNAKDAISAAKRLATASAR
jgi:hypothetical protein